MFQFFNDALDMKEYDFINDNTIMPTERIEFFSHGLRITLTEDCENFKLVMVCLAVTAKTFIEAKKKEFEFNQPQLIINPLNETICVVIDMIEKVKYKEIMELRENE